MGSMRLKGSVGPERRTPAVEPLLARGPGSSPRFGRQAMPKLVLTLIGVVVSGLVAFAAPAAAGPPPSVRLFGSEHRATVTQLTLRVGGADLGLWVASVGGNFQIDVRRPNYGAWSASQIDSATGALLRPVPAAMIDSSGGLKRFLSVRFFDSRGRIAVRRLVTFCPNGESARVDASGPLNQTYPSDCFSASTFPFVRGIVWGIDSGWAVAPAISTIPGFPPGGFGVFPPGGSGGPGAAVPVLPPGVLKHLPPGGINLKPGRYTALVSITLPYQRLFAIPPQQASVKLKVQVLATRTRRPSRRIQLAQPAVDHLARPLSAATVTQPDPSTLPNLVAAPAWAIRVRRASRHELLTFSATIWNAGPAPFSIDGFRRPNSNVMDAYEYFFDSSGKVVGNAPAGTMFYDSERGHHHWHLRQLASYTLVGPTGQALRSQKQSFCIAPTNSVDLTVPGAQGAMNPFLGPGFGGSVCDLYSPNAIWLREQLPVGWGDTYQQWVAGQAFDITNVPNGLYKIEVRVNPLGALHETTTADDLAVRFIRLSGHRGARKIRVASWHGIRG